MQGAGRPPGSAGDDATATGLFAHNDFAPGSLLADRFRVESILGVGGMGVVYRATDEALGVPVALKLLRPELMHRPEAFERFRQELLLARQVSNPHVVRIHDLARHDSQWLISMDFVEGESLDRRLDREGALSIEDALRITRQLAEGLGAAHAKGVVHRDLKPSNVLLDAGGNAYISDFGVARSLATSGMTQSGTVVGTPDYLSPEQARGEPVDARSDLYALGLILYEMLAGKPPFAGGTVSEILAQRMMRTPAPVTTARPEVPAWAARLVDRLLRPQPAHRLQDAAAVIAAIDRRDVPRDWRRAWAGRHAGVAAIAVLALGMALAAGWWLQRANAPPVAASPPLDRLLVMPLQAEGLPAPRLAALGAHLRDGLSAREGQAVVDRERTLQAQRQLDATGGAPADPDALRDLAAARQVLLPRLERAGDGWRATATLHGPGDQQRALDGPVAADPGAALAAWRQQPATIAALGKPAAGGGMRLPDDRTALDAYGAGLLAHAAGELPDALRHLQAATEAAPDYADAWLALAETALATGEQDLAYAALQSGMRALEPDSPGQLRRRFTAELAVLEGDPIAAVAAWRARAEATPDDTFAALNLARAQGAGGDFAAAVDRLQALAQRDANDPRIWYELGKFSILSGDARRAVDEHLVRALVLFKRGGNRFGEAETLNALGIGYGRLGQTADAAEQYRAAAALRREIGNRRGVATSLRNLANIAAMTGEFDAAARYLDEARQLHAELGDRDGLAAIDNELGLLAEERGDYPAALQHYRSALQTWRQLGDPHGTAQALNNIGFANYQLGAYDDAQVYWEQAADAYEQLGSATGRIRTDQNLGLLAIARGQWNKARMLLETSLADAERQQMVEEAAVSHRNLAELELWQGHLAQALDQARLAEDLFRQRDDKRGIADARLLHAQALLAAHADARAADVLDALEPVLADASAEQRAIERLLRARLARRAGNDAAAEAARRQAAALAEVSGVRQLQLQIALEAARAGEPAPTLEDATDRLGHVGLRLAWLERRMRAALDAQPPDTAAALDAWREAAILLREGDFVRAHRLQALAAAALEATGDTAAAEAAREGARRAFDAMRGALPADLRESFEDSDADAVAALGTSAP
ncbi:MAG TPA: tetratricopeptide repeat protein [Xanthomonadaceae bacterium]|nr:tetratricopeptide repeat protein [Xanthomonadaceae bacterium]